MTPKKGAPGGGAPTAFAFVLEWLYPKPITYAGYTVNGRMALTPEPEFGAQGSDEDMQVLPFTLVFLTPHPFQELSMGEHLPDVEHQFLEEVKLSWCQFYFLAVHGYPPSGKVYLKNAAVEDVAGWRGQSNLAAAEHCSYPG